MNGNGSGDGDGRRPAEGDFSERLNRLRTQLDRKGPQAAPGPSSRSGDASALGAAMRLSAEFVGGVVVGGALGWAFDGLLGTKPWGLLVLLVLGVFAGIYNVMRASGFLGPTRGSITRKNGPKGP